MERADRIAAVGLALVALGILREGMRLPFGTWRDPGPAFFPAALALVLLGLALLIAAGGGHSTPLRALGWGEWRHAAAILGASVFAAVALERIGYRLTVLAILLFLLKAVERRGFWLTISVALGLAAGTFYVFDTLLRVPLPRGPFGV